MSASEDEPVYGNTNARPELTQKVRHVGGETRELLLLERGEHEDRGEREERTVDIYVTADELQRSTAPQHGGDSGESKQNVSRAATVCPGLMCLLLSAGIIGLVVHNNNLVKQLDQQTRQNQTEQKAMFETRLDELHTRCTNATQEDKAKLQSSLYELQTKNANLQTRYTNLTEERDVLKRRLCELPGWQKSGSGCYYISTEQKTWEDSRQYCRDNQSDLMVMNSGAKQDFVKGLNQRVWLGLTDTKTEGKFVWVDGTPLTTPKFWNKGEPNNKGPTGDGEEDCVEFLYLSKGGNDRPCSDYNQWICEIVMY